MFQTIIGHHHKTYIFKNQIVSKHIMLLILLLLFTAGVASIPATIPTVAVGSTLIALLTSTMASS